MDNPIVNAAKIAFSNIYRFKIHFKTFDLDKKSNNRGLRYYFFIFSFHHTKNMKDNCKSIAKVCKRIIIGGGRLFEWGRKPVIIAMVN